MTHTYGISGMTCSGCEAKVQKLLSGVAGVTRVNADLTNKEIAIEMRKHIPTETFQQALKDHPKYQLSEDHAELHKNINDEETKTWFQTYRPVLLIFAYLIITTFLIEARQGFLWARWMNNFMGGFFLTFSFFKLLDLKGFAESYSSYDIISKKWPGWGYVYAFIELALGLAYITSFNLLLTNSVTFAVMSISIIGVMQSVLNQRKIKCACLGAVFNLPISTLTIVEDALMIMMSLIALLTLLATI